MNTYAATGLASGLASTSKIISSTSKETEELKRRRAIQDKANQRIEETYQRTSQTSDLNLEELQMTVKKLRNKLTAQDTYSGFSAYRETGDVKYLNQLVQNPDVARHMNGVTGIYKLDTSNESDRAMLRKIGLSDEDIDSPDFDKSRYVKTTRAGSTPGTFEVLDMNGAYAKTGYTKKMTQEELDEMLKMQKKATLAKTESQAEYEELKTASATQWLKDNPGKTMADYESLSKSRTTTAALKKRQIDLKIKETHGTLTQDEQVELDTLNKQISTDSDEKRDIISQGTKMVDKYAKTDIFDPSVEISNDDISSISLYSQQAGIKPNAKAHEEFKDSFVILKTGKRLEDDIMALDDEELSRGLIDTGVQKIRQLFSDNSFNKLSNEDKKKQLLTIKTNTKLGKFLASYIKTMSGTAVSDQEFARLRDLVVGSDFYNTQTLKTAISSFVEELDHEFKVKSRINLRDDPATTLDLARRYKLIGSQKLDKQESATTKDSTDELLGAIANVESSGSYTAKNPKSSAYGKYQFLSSTYNEAAKALGLSYDEVRTPKGQEAAMKWLVSKNSKGLQSSGIKVTPFTVYAAHQQGLTAFKRIVSGKPTEKDIRNLVSNTPAKYRHGNPVKDWKTYWEGKFSKPEPSGTNEYASKLKKYKSLIGKVNPNTGKKLLGFEKEPPYSPIFEEVK